MDAIGWKKKRLCLPEKMVVNRWKRRADASTDWREITSPDGRKYYYNRVTRQSKWTIPDELKLAREQVKMEPFKGTLEVKDVNSHAPSSSISLFGVNKLSPNVDTSPSSSHGVVSSPIPVAPVVSVVSPQPMVTSGSVASPVEPSSVTANAIGAQTPLEIAPPTAASSGNTEISVTSINNVLTLMSPSDNVSVSDVVTAVDGVVVGNMEETKTGVGIAGKTNISASEEKTVDQESLVYENKQDAKNAFKSLLESANVGSDWTWDQAMRAIINDRRYGALRSLGERKQAFNEFLGQKKKQEAEERRAKHKKAREDFKKMLEESKELAPSTRWSKVRAIFEDDERFIAVERAKDREDLFEDYMGELDKKERAKALEEHKRKKTEYIEFLKSCDFIKASSQWRKVQDHLEADERCFCLEKVDRLEIFQEYVRDLEKEEEEHRKLRMEELRKAERKNRDEFRKLMEGHVAAGTLTAKTHWRDYCMKVQDLPAYLAVSSNTSGSTAKDLFEDVLEELVKQYIEDKDCIKDAVKSRKINLSSTWTLEDFKDAILEDSSSPHVSNINLKIVFDELHERVREKEEKEAKKRKRRADDFYERLCTSKEITASSTWENCKAFFEDRQESWFVAEENFFREIFEKYIAGLKEKAKEERKRREDKLGGGYSWLLEGTVSRKKIKKLWNTAPRCLLWLAKKDKDGKDRERKRTKHRRDKERGFESKKGKDKATNEGTDSEITDRTESHRSEENKRSGRDKDKKHRKRPSSSDDLNFDDHEKDRSKSSNRHSSDRKKSKQMKALLLYVEQHVSSAEADVESKSKRHKRDYRSGSHKNGDYEEHEDREFAEDGEVW
ncbi:unnamed protein product [Ilex paraguariensis]|uniref:Pre-mRNA-processing protein 40A n=1 Tax=Ilex paraguariensis TaxID=185542 RepID=A0ABC8RJ30_9AQUA